MSICLAWFLVVCLLLHVLFTQNVKYFFGFLGLWGSVVTVYLATFIKITIGRIHGFQLLPMRLYTCVGVYAIVYYFWITDSKIVRRK